MNTTDRQNDQGDAGTVQDIIQRKRVQSTFDFEKKADALETALEKLSAEQRAVAERLIAEYLSGIVPDMTILGPTAELLAKLSETEKAQLLQNPQFEEKLRKMYLNADRLTRNGTETNDGDLRTDEKLPEFFDNEKFKKWYRDALSGDMQSGVEQLSEKIYYGHAWETLDNLLGRLSKPHIDDSYIARPEVQGFLKELIETELSGNDLTESYSKPGIPFHVLRLLIEIKNKGYIKDGYLESAAFTGKILSAFEKWLKNLYILFKTDPLQAGAKRDIKYYIELASNFVDPAALKATTRNAIKTHSHNDLYDTPEDQKREKLTQFLTELETN